MNWYKGITNTPKNDNEDSFVLIGNSLFSAYRNAIEIMSKNKSDRRLIKVIKAPHLDKYWEEKIIRRNKYIMSEKVKLLKFNEWTRSVGYEKIRGCYRKSDMVIVWVDQVEKEYYDYCNE
tara:strand:- start:363 stop:722 length:360 start_codon:yes stop_codon:yes gene_type:complete